MINTYRRAKSYHRFPEKVRPCISVNVVARQFPEIQFPENDIPENTIPQKQQFSEKKHSRLIAELLMLLTLSA